MGVGLCCFSLAAVALQRWRPAARGVVWQAGIPAACAAAAIHTTAGVLQNLLHGLPWAWGAWPASVLPGAAATGGAAWLGMVAWKWVAGTNASAGGEAALDNSWRMLTTK